jgi:hypothetical protein
MNPLKQEDLFQYVEQHIADFHRRRIESIGSLKLTHMLQRKNPYLFKAKYLPTSEQIVKGLVDAHISSQEETIFGNWLEGLAIFVAGKVYGGRKSGILGIDLELDKEGIRYIVTIKSGPNWGNSSQVKKMIQDFQTAQKTLRTSNSGLQVLAVNGCCYGRDPNPDKGAYIKLCGQAFWAFLSGDEELYKTIIEPVGYQARQRNEAFLESYWPMVNRMAQEFARDFCRSDGSIDWQRLVAYNSAEKPSKL